MADTYFYFVLGFICFWTILFGSIGFLIFRMKKLEQHLQHLESSSRPNP